MRTEDVHIYFVTCHLMRGGDKNNCLNQIDNVGAHSSFTLRKNTNARCCMQRQQNTRVQSRSIKHKQLTGFLALVVHSYNHCHCKVHVLQYTNRPFIRSLNRFHLKQQISLQTSQISPVRCQSRCQQNFCPTNKNKIG